MVLNAGKYQFDLGALYNGAFGAQVQEFNLGTTENETDDYTSKFGSSVYRKQDAMGRYYFMPVKLGDLELSYPIVRIQGRNKLVETELTERDGSVIEIINKSSLNIYVRGFLIGHDGKFPEEDLFNLKEVIGLNRSMPIRSVITDLFLTKEDRVAITNWNFPEVVGIENIKPYELNLVSDSIFELEIE